MKKRKEKQGKHMWMARGPLLGQNLPLLSRLRTSQLFITADSESKNESFIKKLPDLLLASYTGIAII